MTTDSATYDNGYNFQDQLSWDKYDLLPSVGPTPTPTPDKEGATPKEVNINRLNNRAAMLQALTPKSQAQYQPTYPINPYNPLENLQYNVNTKAPSSYVSGQMRTWDQINPGQQYRPPTNTPVGQQPTTPVPYQQPTYNTPTTPVYNAIGEPHGQIPQAPNTPLQPATADTAKWNAEFSKLNNIPVNLKWDAAGQNAYLRRLAAANPSIYRLPSFANGGSVTAINKIAAQGRNGDSMLVHMTPDEVGGLASLAQAHGRPLTTNPNTGLPEAFNLKDWIVPAALIGATLMTGGAATPAAAGAMGGTAAGTGGALSTGMALGASAASTGAAGSGIAGLGSMLTSPIAQTAIPATVKFAQTGDLGQAAAAGAMGWGTGQIMGNLMGAGEAANQGASTAASSNVANQTPSFGVENIGTNLSNIGKNIQQAVSSQDALGQFVKDNKTAGLAIMGGAMANDTFARNQAMQEENDAKNAKDAEHRKRLQERIAGTYAAQGRAQPQFVSRFAEGGIADIGPRYLKGDGDGMSDSIPAEIDGTQPAALARNEFVIPADVVSGLGNGSSDAGAQQLYDMMDRIREVRTGTSKQPKRINPKKMLPA